MQKEKRNKIIGILLIVIGIVFWIIPFYNNKIEDKKEDNLINEYIDSTEQEIIINEPETVPEETKTVERIKYSMIISNLLLWESAKPAFISNSFDCTAGKALHHKATV